ncbi:hypothetical protein ACHAXA_007364, partial [Cyclostephanos tholiformis]
YPTSTPPAAPRRPEVLLSRDLSGRQRRRPAMTTGIMGNDDLDVHNRSRNRKQERMLSDWSNSLIVAPLPKTGDGRDDVGVGNEMKSRTVASPPPPPPALLSFGSYRLGVHSPDADVDCLVLAPPHCRREDFFGGWVDMLGRMTTNDDENGTPGRISGLDESSVRSVNGVRVAQFLLDSISTPDECDGPPPPPVDTTITTTSAPVVVPSAINDAILRRLDNFRLTLRLVKAWARNHGLYANVLGFLGGVNWAILVCWVCERNPDESPSRLLQIFFRTFAYWKWPVPVTLSKQQNDPPAGGERERVAGLTCALVKPLPTWDPIKNYRDSKHIMPIITPCYPPMNSSYNVGEPQLRRMRDELLRASKLCDSMMNDNSLSLCSCWDDLFKGTEFFKQHANYLQVCAVDITGNNEDEFRYWFGLCESRMRLLIVGLESPIDGVQAYPYAKFFHRREKKGMEGGIDGENVKCVTSYFVALRFAHTAKRIDLGPLVRDFLQMVNSVEGRTSSMDLAMHIVAKNDLPPYVFADSK